MGEEGKEGRVGLTERVVWDWSFGNFKFEMEILRVFGRVVDGLRHGKGICWGCA